jgi:hypothetical protein
MLQILSTKFCGKEDIHWMTVSAKILSQTKTKLSDFPILVHSKGKSVVIHKKRLIDFSLGYETAYCISGSSFMILYISFISFILFFLRQNFS